jgi:aconitate hydratase
MFNLTVRSVKLGRTVQRILNGGLATAAPRIGDTKVEMSPLEQGNFINYQRIEDNLTVVRSRFVLALLVIAG